MKQLHMWEILLLLTSFSIAVGFSVYFQGTLGIKGFIFYWIGAIAFSIEQSWINRYVK